MGKHISNKHQKSRSGELTVWANTLVINIKSQDLES